MLDRLQGNQPLKESVRTMLAARRLTHSILLVGACLSARRERVNGLGAVTLPLLAAMVMVALGPCIECQDRYGFPIMYSMPLVLACLGFLLRQKQAMRADE